VWDDPPDADDSLRQGDLLINVPFPALPVPLQTTAAVARREEDIQAIVNVRHRTALVVSHCCSSNDEYVALAPVTPKRINPLQEAALLAEEPPQGAGLDISGYDVAHFRLLSLENVLDDIDPGFHVADLTRILSFSGGCANLIALRRGRLTPLGRRLLRIKLALFWGRAEQGDAEALEAQGVPPGLTPYPPA
jgi:hypothetical protein